MKELGSDPFPVYEFVCLCTKRKNDLENLKKKFFTSIYGRISVNLLSKRKQL